MGPLPDPRASGSNPGPSAAGGKAPPQRLAPDGRWRGGKWHQDTLESAGEMAHLVGRAVAARRGHRCASPARPCPGSATRGRGPGAGGRWARPLPPGLRLGLTSLTSPCQSLSVRSLFMAFSCRRGRAAWTPPSSARDPLSPPRRRRRLHPGPGRARRLRAAAPPPPAAAALLTQRQPRREEGEEEPWLPGRSHSPARPGPPRAPRDPRPPPPARAREGRGSPGFSPEVTPDPSIIALEGGR